LTLFKYKSNISPTFFKKHFNFNTFHYKNFLNGKLTGVFMNKKLTLSLILILITAPELNTCPGGDTPSLTIPSPAVSDDCDSPMAFSMAESIRDMLEQPGKLDEALDLYHDVIIQLYLSHSRLVSERTAIYSDRKKLSKAEAEYQTILNHTHALETYIRFYLDNEIERHVTKWIVPQHRTDLISKLEKWLLIQKKQQPGDRCWDTGRSELVAAVSEEYKPKLRALRELLAS